MARFYERLITGLGGAPAVVGPTTKLSESQAIQIARNAASDGHDTSELTLATRTVKDGRIVWNVSEPAIGNVLVVDVDDETATVTAVRRVGSR